MDHSLLVFATSFSSLLLLLLTATADTTTGDIHVVQRDVHSDIAKFCEQTTNPTLCTQTLKPHLHGAAVDPLKALEFEVQATHKEAEKTFKEIESLLGKSDNNKSTKDSLTICKEQYNSMLDDIASTKEALAKNDLVTAKMKFSAVIAYQSVCHDAFEGDKIPFPEDSKAVYQLGGNCLDIIAGMEKAAGPVNLPPPAPHVPSAFSNVIGTVS